MYQTRSYNKRMNVWYAYEVEYVWDELNVNDLLVCPDFCYQKCP